MSKRDDILNATLELIDEKGIQSVTFAKIFKRANVGSGTLYNYFSNKDEIISELFLRSISILESYELPADFQELDLIEKFNILMDVFIDFMTNYRKEYFFVESFSDYPSVRELIDSSNYYGVLKELYSIIELGQSKGVFRVMDINISIQMISGIISMTYKGALHGKYDFDQSCISEIYLSCWKALLK